MLINAASTIQCWNTVWSRWLFWENMSQHVWDNIHCHSAHLFMFKRYVLPGVVKENLSHNCTSLSTKWGTTTQHTAVNGSQNNKIAQMTDWQLDSLLISCIKDEVYIPPLPRTQNIIFKVRKTFLQLVLLKLLHLCTIHSWVFHSFVTLCTLHWQTMKALQNWLKLWHSVTLEFIQ